jgi:hypothetical protein
VHLAILNTKNTSGHNFFLEQKAWDFFINAIPAFSSRFCVFRKTQRAPTIPQSGLFDGLGFFIWKVNSFKCKS